MPRHRAATPRTRALSTVALTGAALGATVLSPVAAMAATPSTEHFPAANSADSGGVALRTDSDHGAHHAKAKKTKARKIPAKNRHRSIRRNLTSGEEQYRNGCRQGYIQDGCDAFSVPSLLNKGINPYL